MFCSPAWKAANTSLFYLDVLPPPKCSATTSLNIPHDPRGCMTPPWAFLLKIEGNHLKHMLRSSLDVISHQLL